MSLHLSWLEEFSFTSKQGLRGTYCICCNCLGELSICYFFLLGGNVSDLSVLTRVKSLGLLLNGNPESADGLDKVPEGGGDDEGGGADSGAETAEPILRHIMS